MSTDENKRLVRRFYEEIDAGNLDAMDELVAEDYVDHFPPPFPLPPGREGLKQAFRLFWDATPGVHVIEDQIAEGDKVVTRLTARGVREGDLPRIPATGKPIEMTATVIHRIENGRLAEKWSDKDVLRLLQQLDVFPSPADRQADHVPVRALPAVAASALPTDRASAPRARVVGPGGRTMLEPAAKQFSELELATADVGRETPGQLMRFRRLPWGVAPSWLPVPVT